MRCRMCEREVQDGARFCPWCGSAMAQAQAYSEGNDPNARVEESATGNMRAPDGSYDMRSYCNSTPDDAKCRINNMGETNKGG